MARLCFPQCSRTGPLVGMWRLVGSEPMLDWKHGPLKLREVLAAALRRLHGLLPATGAGLKLSVPLHHLLASSLKLFKNIYNSPLCPLPRSPSVTHHRRWLWLNPRCTRQCWNLKREGEEALAIVVWYKWGVQFSRSVMSDCLPPHGLQHTRLPCPSPTPRVYSNSCP